MKAVDDLERIAQQLRAPDGLLSADSIALQNIAQHILSTEKYVHDLKRETVNLQDQFAASALVGMLASWERGAARRDAAGRIYDTNEVAEDAYAFARSMMRVRARLAREDAPSV